MVTEEVLTLGGGPTIQYTDDVLIELYTWNLYNFINHCHPNKFNNFLKIATILTFNRIAIFFPHAWMLWYAIYVFPLFP